MRSIGHILQHTATVSRATRSIVNSQVVDQMQVVASGVPCRLTSPSRGGIVIHGGAEQPPRPRLCYFEPTADIRRDDRITVGGTSYRVLDAEDQPDGIYRACSLEVLG